MGFLAKLSVGIRAEHRKVGTKPFVAQYGQGKVTLVDHYRHLQQLTWIYAVIESKMKNQGLIVIPEKLQEIINRSELIKADMAFLAPHVPREVQSALAADATVAYLRSLHQLDVNTEAGCDALLAHFLVRILGDLFGGQSIKGDVEALYARVELTREGNEGVQFYVFSEGMLKRCSKWLDSLEAGDGKLFQDESRMEGVIAEAKQAFIAHDRIFDELESTKQEVALVPQRAPIQSNLFMGTCAANKAHEAPTPSKQPSPSYGRFFAIGACAAIVAAGAVAAAYACDENASKLW